MNTHTSGMLTLYYHPKKEGDTTYIEPKNNNSYTNEILNKIRAAGIEVVTNKVEHSKTLNRIIETNVILEMLEDNPLKIEKGRSQLNADSIPNSTNIIDIRNNQEYYVNKKKGRIYINEVTSMYGRNNEIDFVKSNVDEDKLVYLDKTRTHKWIEQQLINEKSLGGDRAFKVQFLEQRVTDIETYNPSILTKDKLVKVITSGINTSIQKMVTAENTYGFVHNGKIYLNPELMNSNATVHEYTHLWDAYSCITIRKRKVIQLYL